MHLRVLMVLLYSFETESHSIALARLDLPCRHASAPQVLELKAGAITPTFSSF